MLKLTLLYDVLKVFPGICELEAVLFVFVKEVLIKDVLCVLYGIL